MAYSSLLNQSVSNESDLLDKLYDFLVNTLSWTSHDDQRSTNNYFVVTSTGEDGKAKLCMKFTKGSSKIDVRQYLSWDSTNHTGKKESGGPYSYISSSSSEHTAWFYGDKDHIVVITKVSGNYYCFYGGLYDTLYNKDYATTQASVSSGDNVSVNVDDASILEANEYYLIMDDDNCERAKITNISGNTITFEHLNNSYASGARVGEDPMPNIVSKYNLGGAVGSSIYQQFYYDGTVGTNYYAATYQAMDPSVESCINDAKRYNRRYFFPIALVNTNATYKELFGYLKYVFTFDKTEQSILPEDNITYGGKTYDVFIIYGNNYVMVIPRSV